MGAFRLLRGRVPAPLTISGTPSSTATVGTPYGFTPVVGGAIGAKTFSLSGTLPGGLSFNTSTGAITGTPTTSELKIGLVITVTDSAGAPRSTALASFSITVSSTSIAFASPGASWNGTPLTGAAAPTDPPRSVGKPIAHFLTVSDQSFDSDMTIHVMARAPGGIASVKFYHEGNTTTVTSSRLNTITKADGTTKVRDTFAIKLKYSDWAAHLTGYGANIYAEVTANDYLGQVFEKRVLPPIMVKPVATKNATTWTVSSNGQDNAGNALPTATYPGTTFTTLGAALAALKAMATGSFPSDAWDSMPIDPLILIVKDGNYDIGSNIITSRSSLCWTTIACGAGVTATINRTSFPDANDPATWNWKPPVGHLEFRGPGLTLDHKNFARIDTQGGWGGVWDQSTVFPLGSQVWRNGCKTTNSCAAVTDTRGFSSPMLNTYWNNGHHPGYLAFSSSLGSGDLGEYHTDDAVEYLGGGTSTANFIDGTTYKEIAGDIIDSALCTIHTYSRHLDTRFYEPDVHNSFHVTYSGGGTLTLEKSTLRGGDSSHWINGQGSLFLVLNGVLQGSGILLGQVPSDGNYTWAQVKASIDALAISGLTVTVDDTTNVFGARFFVGFGQEGGFAPQTISGTVQFTCFPAVHTEWAHLNGKENVLIWGNVCRDSMFGTSDYFCETGSKDVWCANNLHQLLDTSTQLGAITHGGLNAHFLHNYDEDSHILDTVEGDAVSRMNANVMGGLGGTITGLSMLLKNNLCKDNLTSADASNVALTSPQFDAVFTDRTNGDFRAASGAMIDTNQCAPLEVYDMFYNTRSGTDWTGPISKNQASAPTWPF